MGRGSNVETTRAVVRALALHPADGTARSCALGFSARGVVLEEPGFVGASGDAAPLRLLRVPWWALRGFSADECTATPDGRVLQALDLVTDAGTLRLALCASDVGFALSLLSRYSGLWRYWRVPALQWAGRQSAITGAMGRDAADRAGSAVRAARRRPVLVLSLIAALALSTFTIAGSAIASGGGTSHRVRASLTSTGPSVDISGMAGMVGGVHLRDGSAVRLAPASAPPPPAPPSVVDAPALAPHEVFGFVPYWMLGEEAEFDVRGFTTLAYFAVGANADGTLDDAGTGWDGYESQAFADLVARAHAAGDRVVLTVNCFSLPALASLTSSHAAASALATSVVGAIAAKNLDGVNIDFEGGDGAERSGLTTLVATVASAVHAANPHFQVTVDTDGVSAADPNGFYDVPALGSVADGLFVMSYGLNYGATPTKASPITSDDLSDAAEASQYAAAVAPSKVIFGISYFGYSWATTNGTMAARATKTGTPVTYAQVVASGHTMYWDPVTDSAWTSYETGGQWYEDYVNDPASVYLVTRLAQQEGFAGVGVWALGMDGNDPQMLAALDGNAPVVRAGPAGPVWTAPSKTPQKPGPTGGVTAAAKPRQTASTTTSTTTTSTTSAPPAGTTTTSTTVTTTTSTTTTATPATASTATTTAGGNATTATTDPTTAARPSP